MIRRVKVNAYKVGVVLKNGKVKKVVENDSTWLMADEQISFYDKLLPLSYQIDFDILLKNDVLASMIEMITVKDEQLLIVYENAILIQVYTTGRHAFWKGTKEYQFIVVDTNSDFINEQITKATLTNIKISPYIRKFVVKTYEKGLLFIDNKFVKQLESGTFYFWQNETPVEVKTADMRMQQMEIAGQELLTKDKANLRINFFVKYRIEDIQKALIENKDFEKQLYVSMQLILREFVGTMTLDELLARKDMLSNDILKEGKIKAQSYGVQVVEAGVRDIILPGEMKEIMNQVLIAEKKAQANIITRREETASVRSMLNTAKLMEENEMLYKLKEMEYIEKIADQIGEISISGGGNIVGQLKEIFAK